MVNLPDLNQGKSPLMMACSLQPNSEQSVLQMHPVVQLLLENGADICALDFKGNNVFAWAFAHGKCSLPAY
jgi:hypothetical protein